MAKKYPLVILHCFIPVHTHQYFLLNSGGSWWCLRWGLTRSLYTPAVTYLLNAVASGGGTRPKAMCSGILAASMSSWPSRTCQSDPGVSSTIKSAGTMQIVPFCQHSVTKAKKYVGFFPFFRSETEGSGTLLHSPIFFSSVAEILNGGVKISNNPKLCNMDTVLWNDIIDTSKKPLTVLEFASNLSSCEY